eukprot:3777055-Pleurochrysis_carterae.AAC.1
MLKGAITCGSAPSTRFRAVRSRQFPSMRGNRARTSVLNFCVGIKERARCARGAGNKHLPIPMWLPVHANPPEPE